MFGALLFALTFLGFIVFRSFWPLFTVRFFQGVAFASFDTAALALIMGIIPSVYRTRALGYYLLAPSLAMAAGAPVGVFIVNQYSFTVLFLCCMGFSFCTLFMSWRTKEQKVVDSDKDISLHSAFFDLKILVPGISAFLQFFVWGALSAFFPLYAIHCGVTNPGLFFSAMAVMMIVGRMFGGHFMDTCNKEKFIVSFLPGVLVLFVILSFSKTLPMFIFVGSFWGLGMAFFVPIAMAYALDYSGSSSGTAVSTFRALQDLGMALGPTIMGLIIPLTGYPIMFLCLAFVSLINLFYFQLYVRRKNKQRQQ